MYRFPPPCPELLTKYESLVNMDTYFHKQFLTVKTKYCITIIFHYICIRLYNNIHKFNIFREDTFNSSFIKIYLLFYLNITLCTAEYLR